MFTLRTGSRCGRPPIDWLLLLSTKLEENSGRSAAQRSPWRSAGDAGGVRRRSSAPLRLLGGKVSGSVSRWSNWNKSPLVGGRTAHCPACQTARLTLSAGGRRHRNEPGRGYIDRLQRDRNSQKRLDWNRSPTQCQCRRSPCHCWRAGIVWLDSSETVILGELRKMHIGVISIVNIFQEKTARNPVTENTYK